MRLSWSRWSLSRLHPEFAATCRLVVRARAADMTCHGVGKNVKKQGLVGQKRSPARPSERASSDLEAVTASAIQYFGLPRPEQLADDLLCRLHASTCAQVVKSEQQQSDHDSSWFHGYEAKGRPAHFPLNCSITCSRSLLDAFGPMPAFKTASMECH